MTVAKVSEQELRWKCRRGMLELDLLLNRFIDNHFQTLDESQLEVLIRLLDYPDQVLHDLLIAGLPSSDREVSQLIGQITLDSF